MLTNANILINGGAGSFGYKLTLAKFNPKKIIIYSRDGMKQLEIAKLYANENRLDFHWRCSR